MEPPDHALGRPAAVSAQVHSRSDLTCMSLFASFTAGHAVSNPMLATLVVALGERARDLEPLSHRHRSDYYLSPRGPSRRQARSRAMTPTYANVAVGQEGQARYLREETRRALLGRGLPCLRCVLLPI